jgi:hypothetical protein
LGKSRAPSERENHEKAELSDFHPTDCTKDGWNLGDR